MKKTKQAATPYDAVRVTQVWCTEMFSLVDVGNANVHGVGTDLSARKANERPRRGSAVEWTATIQG